MAAQMSGEIQSVSLNTIILNKNKAERSEDNDDILGSNNDTQLEDVTPMDNLNDQVHQPPVIFGFQVPELSKTVQYHLFVAHASDDRESVVKIIEELERKFGIRCLFADRDFQPGKTIWTNIEDGLNKSLKVLIIFTPNFMLSHNCQVEAEGAYSMSLERGNDCVIPLLLEDCDIPRRLKPRTYIDATLPSMDLAIVTEKIMEALVKIESPAEILPLKFSSNKSKYKNGNFVEIRPRVSGGINCKAVTYKFYLTNSTVREVTSYNINTTPRQMQQAIAILNEDPTISGYFYLNKSRLFCWGLCTFPSILFLCLSIFLGLMLGLSTDSTSAIVASMVTTGHWLAWIPCGMTVLICTGLVLFGYVKTGKTVSNVQEKLWRELSSRTMRDGVLFIFVYSWLGAPSLCVMRYDVNPCKLYLMTLLKNNGPYKEKSDDELESVAEDTIQKYAKYMCSLDSNILSFPSAEYNRHNVLDDRMCLCQLYQWSNT